MKDSHQKLVPAPPRRESLFISYARHDDEAFVARLYDDLTSLGFTLWWDRRCMPNRGLTFLREIRDAINSAGRLIFVFGPQAAQSDYVRAEWQYACSIGMPVMTLLRLGDYDRLPGALAHSDVLDFRRDEHYEARLDALVRQLAQPVAPLGRLIGVPELPPQYQPRPAELAAVRAALLRDSHAPVVLTAVGRRAGMQGMGGIGKSVLAAAVVREFDVRRAFPDGLVWVALGTDPNLPVRLAEACRAFGDAASIFFDAGQGRARLSELLADRASLLVLDDVWELEHVRAFDALGPRGALFITTRDERLLDELGALKHRLDVLAPDDALRLMAAWLVAPDPFVADPEARKSAQVLDQTVATMPVEARLVAQECGYLPLALALSAAQARDGVAWGSVLEALREADLQYLDHPNGSVFRSIKISVDSLERDDARYARLYLELAAFPQGAAIPEGTIRAFWQHTGGLSLRASDKLLVTLARRALIRLGGEAPRRHVQLHDLQHDYLRALAGDIKSLHAALLDAYRASIAGDWPQGNDDGYYFQRLAYHLAGAGRGEELCALLTASPAWMEAEFRACAGDTQFAADIELALKDPVGQRPLERIALMAARQVIHQRVEAYSDTDIETLVYLGRSTEALSHARLRPDPGRRISSIVCAQRALSEVNQAGADLLDEALALAPQTKPADRQVLSDLSRALYDAGRSTEALEVAALANRDRGRNYLPNELIAFLAGQKRFADAAAVARTLPETPQRVRELLLVARASREAGMSSFAEAIVVEAVSYAHGSDGAGDEPENHSRPWRSEALQSAAEILGEHDPQARELWKEAVEVVLRSDGYRDGDLKEVAVKLARLGETELVLAAISGSTYPEFFLKQKIREIVDSAMEAAQFDTALAVAALIEAPELRAKALGPLAGALYEARDSRVAAVIDEAIAAAEQIKHDPEAAGGLYAETLCFLAEALNRIGSPLAFKMLDGALSDVRSAQAGEPGEAEPLASVAQTMLRMNLVDDAGALFDEAFGLAEEGRGSFFNLAVMAAEVGDVERAIYAALKAGREHAEAPLKWVAETFAKAGLAEAARRAVDSIADRDAHDSTLTNVAARLAAQDAVTARAYFEDALTNRSWPLGFVLIDIARAPHCWTPEFIELALSAAPHVADPQYRREALRELLPHLATRGWTDCCEKLIEVASSLSLLPSLSDELVKNSEKALDAGHVETSLLLAQRIDDEEHRSWSLSGVAIAMAEAGDPRALDVTRSAGGAARARALEAIAHARARAGELPEAEAILEETLTARRQSASVSDQDAAVRKVAAALAGLGELNGALAALRAVEDERERAGSLAEIASALLRGGRFGSALEVAASFTQPLVRARALLILADASEDRALLSEALSEAQTDSTPHHEVLKDWIETLCESASQHSAKDEPLARRLLEAAGAACSNISDRSWRAKQQAYVAGSIARAGWLAEALAAARAVENGGENDYGYTRADAIASVATAMAEAGDAAGARAAAEEADRVSTEAVLLVVSQAPMSLPEGFDSEHRRRIEVLLAEGDKPTPEERPVAHPDDGEAARLPNEPWGELVRTLDTQGMENFLIMLAGGRELKRESNSLAVAALKEATRIAGWISPTWKMISESITAAR